MRPDEAKEEALQSDIDFERAIARTEEDDRTDMELDGWLEVRYEGLFESDNDPNPYDGTYSEE